MGFGIFKKYKKGQRKMIMSFKDHAKGFIQHPNDTLTPQFGANGHGIRQNIVGANGHGIRQNIVGANGHGIRRFT
jgi:hypothetical protein